MNVKNEMPIGEKDMERWKMRVQNGIGGAREEVGVLVYVQCEQICGDRDGEERFSSRTPSRTWSEPDLRNR